MSWPWQDPTDLDRIDPHAPSLIADALSAWRVEPFRQPLPWPSWALRLPALFHTTTPCAPFAAALALLTAPATPTLAARRLALALTLLAPLGVKREALALLLLECQQLAPPPPILPGGEVTEVENLARDAALLWGLAALCAGTDPQPWLHFAAALVEPLALFASLADLVDDTPRAALQPLRLDALLRACAHEDSARSALLDGCAGGFGYLERLIELRAAMGHEAILRQLRAQRETLLSCARAALPTRAGEPGSAFLDALDAGFATLDSDLWTRALVARALGGTPDVLARSALSLRGATDFLEATKPWQSAWDIHRFHPMGAPGMLIGRGFVEGLILLTLSEITSRNQHEIAALIDRVAMGDARYFPDWTGLPPDSDSLGLLLQLATRVDAPRAKVDSWITVLELSLDETRIVPVWLERGPQGKTASLDGPFMGNDCTAVRLAFLVGAARYDAQRFASLLRVNLASLLPRLQGHVFAGCFHYEPPFATHMLLRLLHMLCTSALPDIRELCRALELSASLQRCAASLLAAQRLDGSWGSPQQTALALTALAPLPEIANERLLRALKYLGDTQSPDGAWPAEPLYITPGKHGGMVPFGSREMTTALCAKGLSAGYLRSGGEPLSWSSLCEEGRAKSVGEIS